MSELAIKTLIAYIRSLPIHHSQQEIESGDDYSIFSYYLKPSLDFVQRLLWHRDKVEVLSPIFFREEIKNLINNLINNMLMRYT